MSNTHRAVVVTGASGGIGSAICERLRQDGYWTIGVDRVVPSVGYADAHLTSDLDVVGRSDQVATALASEIRILAGGMPIHGIVHAAALQLVGSTEVLPVEDLLRTMAVNVLAPYALTRALVADLRASGGAVVLVTSIHSRLTKPGFTAYATSKAAMSGLARCLSLDLAPDIRVNEVSPAATDTAMLRDGFGPEWNERTSRRLGEMHPLGRIAHPGEVAATVAFLLSRDASFITGTVIEVGGGIHARLHDIF
jgi:NAD(P)-dependent dehydrogenase (short-subunit alcohol dehydrogenase family)